jgi:hypothetical protein
VDAGYLFIFAFTFHFIMSLPILERLPWSSCPEPKSYPFTLRKDEHDINYFEDAIFYSRIISPHLECYQLNILSIEQTLTESSPIAHLVPDHRAHSNVIPILLVYRIFDIMDGRKLNTRHHPRAPFKFNHPCVCHASLLSSVLTCFSVFWNGQLVQTSF